MAFDIDQVRTGVEGYTLPAAEPFPERLPRLQSSEATTSQHEEVEAGQRRRPRTRKEITIDGEGTQLRTAELQRWQVEYIENMHVARSHKAHIKDNNMARKRAAAWVFGNGVGGIGQNFGSSNLPNPLAMFAGDALWQAITGISATAATPGRKRGSEEVASEGDGRRVRRRSNEQEVGRGDDDGLHVFQDDVCSMSLGSHELVLTYCRTLRLAVMPCHSWKTARRKCPGTSALPFKAPSVALVWALFGLRGLAPPPIRALVSPASAASLPVEDFQALSRWAHLIGECPITNPVHHHWQAGVVHFKLSRAWRTIGWPELYLAMTMSLSSTAQPLL